MTPGYRAVATNVVTVQDSFNSALAVLTLFLLLFPFTALSERMGVPRHMPFTKEQFLQIFQEYNLTLWPMQIVLVLLGLTAIYFAVVRTKPSNTIIAGVLCFLWIW